MAAGLPSLSIERLHATPAQDFEWDESSTNEAAHLTCGVVDKNDKLLYLGQSVGRVIVLSLSDLGTHKPRLLGSHGGTVTAICVYPSSPVTLVASSSADNTVKVWTHEPKAFHSTKACLQTLYGHAAAVTCMATVHEYLVSGGTDGAVLLWKPTDSGLLATPQFRLVAKLWSSEHWVLGLSCRPQPTDTGAGQGIFVAVANQPLLRLQFDKWAVQQAAHDTAQCCCKVQFFAQSHNSIGPARSAKPCNEHGQPAAAAAASSMGCTVLTHKSSTSGNNTSRPVDPALRSNSPGSVLGSSNGSRTACRPGNSQQQGHSPIKSIRAGNAASQDLSVFAVQFVALELAVLTLAYDGCCRLHSAVDGGLRCCWRHPHGTRYTAMEYTENGTRAEVLLGDERGSLHVYSLATQQLLATKQLANSKIQAIITCSSRTCGSPGTASSTASSSSSVCSRTQFAVLTAAGLGFWQLRTGLDHGLLPGGHRAAVLAVQVCKANVQVNIGQPTLHDRGSSLSAAEATGLQSRQSRASTGSTDASGLASQAAAVPTSRACIADNSNTGIVSAAKGGSGSGCSSVSIRSSLSAMMLVSGGVDNKVLQWDLAGGPSVMSSLEAGQIGSDLSAVTFLQNWSILATGHEDGCVVLWRLDTASHQVLGPESHANTVCSLAPALTAKGDELLLSGSYDGSVSLWEPRQLRGVKPHLLARFDAFGLSAEALLDAYNLARLCDTSTAGWRSKTTVEDAAAAARRKKRATMQSASRARSAGVAVAAALAFASLSGSGAVGVQQVTEIDSRSGESKIVSLSGMQSGSGGYRSPVLPGLAQQQQQQEQQQQGSGDSSTPACYRSLLTSSSGRWLGQLQRQCAQQPRECQSLGACNGGNFPGAAVAATRPANQRESSSGEAAAAVQEGLLESSEPPEVLTVLFDSYKQLVITGGNTGAIRVWSGSCSGELLGQHLGHTGPINCLALDGNFLFSGSNDKSIRMWDVFPPHFASSRTSCSTTPRHNSAASKAGSLQYGRPTPQCQSQAGTDLQGTENVRQNTCQLKWSDLDFRSSSSSNGSRSQAGVKLPQLRCSSPCQQLRISIPNSKAFQVLQGHTAAVTGLDVAQSGGLLVSCGRDGRLLQWDYTTGQLVVQQQLPGQELLCLAVRQDTGQVYVGTNQAQILSFDVAVPPPRFEPVAASSAVDADAC